MIDAAIDHEHAFMKSKENTDVYASAEPQQAFHQRIQYCLNMHNESVKVGPKFSCITLSGVTHQPFSHLQAMRYPRKPTQENSEVTKELQELEREMAELAEEEDDMDMDDEGDF